MNYFGYKKRQNYNVAKRFVASVKSFFFWPNASSLCERPQNVAAVYRSSKSLAPSGGHVAAGKAETFELTLRLNYLIINCYVRYYITCIDFHIFIGLIDVPITLLLCVNVLKRSY